MICSRPIVVSALRKRSSSSSCSQSLGSFVKPSAQWSREKIGARPDLPCETRARRKWRPLQTSHSLASSKSLLLFSRRLALSAKLVRERQQRMRPLFGREKKKKKGICKTWQICQLASNSSRNPSAPDTKPDRTPSLRVICS